MLSELDFKDGNFFRFWIEYKKRVHFVSNHCKLSKHQIYKKNQIFIVLEISRGPSPRLSTWPTRLRRNIAAVAII